ncbi:MAG: hypothetical protein ACI8ZB_000708 [Desulforhopalus sp.]|jgi:hypothetical protein
MKLGRFLTTATLFCFVTIFYTTALADCNTTQCYGLIERLYVNEAGTLYIATDGDETALNCTSPADVYIVMLPNDTSFNRKYAMLLTAMTMEKKVGLRINEGSVNCSLNYAYVDRVDQ